MRPVALEITNIQKADEGTIGCYHEENFAEVTFEVLGECAMYIMMKMHGPYPQVKYNIY